MRLRTATAHTRTLGLVIRGPGSSHLFIAIPGHFPDIGCNRGALDR